MSFNKKLLVYVDSWVEKGIISEEQRTLIKKDLKNNSNTFFNTISIIGALFIGIGVILVISANWQYLSKFIKLIIILTMPIISIGGGYYLSYIKKEYKKIGDSFIFLGSLLIGASLSLLGQLYNMNGSVTGLLTLWLLLSIPLTFILKFKSIAALNIVLFYLILFFSFQDIDSNIKTFLLIFTIASALIIALTISASRIKNQIIEQYLSIMNVFKIISVKVLLLTLFIGTISSYFTFFGDFGKGTFILHNIVFLIVLFWVIWESNRTNNALLRHIAFLWLGLFMIVKYFAWFWSYMNTGIFFVLFGIFLILMVFAYIKGIKYLEKIKKQGFNEGFKEGQKKVQE